MPTTVTSPQETVVQQTRVPILPERGAPILEKRLLTFVPAKDIWLGYSDEAKACERMGGSSESQ